MSDGTSGVRVGGPSGSRSAPNSDWLEAWKINQGST